MDYYTIGENGCYEWTGSRFQSGYGRLKIGGKSYRAHRLAWAAANGPIPDGLYVLHKCDNRLCVRVDHLFLGTHDDNMADMSAKGRGQHSRVQAKGELSARAKLSDEDVSVVRRRYEAGGTSQDALAKEYGVSQGLISQIVRGAHRPAG